MPFRLYDTRARGLVEFVPATPGKVSIYNCGPTVYGTPHIGNFRSFLFADVLRRYLEWRGYEVTQVMNITDVGHLTEDDRADARGADKLQKTAEALGWDPYRVARHFEQEFFDQSKALGIQPAHLYPRATEHIADMLAQVQQLLDRGHAYIPEGTGEAYFDLSTFPSYGALSGKDIEALQAGARIEVNQVKRHPGDFALWKADPGHLMQWDPHDPELWKQWQGDKPHVDARLGRGFPGWHIECSAMSIRYLGISFDLHTGGEDNIFPHHECEIAQACGATGGGYARHWMHVRHLLVNGAKMSKSAGTLYRLSDILEAGFTTKELRYALISNHYRQPMNFTFDGLKAARSSLQRLQNTRDLLAERGSTGTSAQPTSTEVQTAIDTFEQAFGAGMDDDLNVSSALAALFAFVGEIHKQNPSAEDARRLLTALDRADHVLGLLSRGEPKTGTLTRAQLAGAPRLSPPEQETLLLGTSQPTAELVLALAALRHQARSEKNFALADRVRDHLKRLGVTLEDNPDGVRYRLP